MELARRLEIAHIGPGRRLPNLACEKPTHKTCDVSIPIGESMAEPNLPALGGNAFID